MHRKSVILLVGFIVISTVSLCWAASPFQQILRDMKDQADTVSAKTQDIEHLVNRIRQLAVEIDDVSNTIEFKDQKDKIERLEVKADRFQELVDELDYKTDTLKELAAKLHHESRMLSTKPQVKRVENCGPGKVWIPGQKSPSGKWVPGHCAPSY